VSLLEKLTELPIQIQYKLANSISLNLYETYRNALIDGKKFNSQTLKPYTQCPIFISSITELPKNLTIVSGSYFSGNMTFAKEDNRKKAENYSFKYIIDSEQQKKSAQKDSKQTETNDKTLEEQFSEALNELKITWLSK
jgi:tripeptidyl-peptidase-2